jgi:APA family basic amino acid/polyamine antiporter
VACNLILEYTLSVAVCARAATAYGATLLGFQPEAALIRLGPFNLDISAVLLIAALGTLLALGTKESATFNSGAPVASRKLQLPFLCRLGS